MLKKAEWHGEHMTLHSRKCHLENMKLFAAWAYNTARSLWLPKTFELQP